MLALLLLLLQLKAATVPHSAVLYYQSASCTNSSPCTLAVYRTVCPTATTCPSYGNGHGWTRLTSGTVTANPTSSGTTWVVTDTDPVLQDNTTYAYVATLAWVSYPNRISATGAVWSGTTSSGGGASTPPAPVVGVNNSVQ